MEIRKLIEEDLFAKLFFEAVQYDNMDDCRVKTLDKKTVIAKKDGPVEFCNLIVSGKMRVYNEFPNGRNFVLDSIGTGAIIGEMEAVAGLENFTSTVDCATKCVAVGIPIDIYRKWFFEHKYFSIAAAKRMARMMCDMSTVHGENVVYSSELTLALLLSRLYQEGVPAGPGRIIDETREALSEKSGFSVRSVNRVVGKFRDLQLLELKKGKIYMEDVHDAKLKAFIRNNS